MRIAAHPKVEFAGFCDVDAKVLEKIGKEHPHAFLVADYREAFAQHLDRFDAVNVRKIELLHVQETCRSILENWNLKKMNVVIQMQLIWMDLNILM